MLSKIVLAIGYLIGLFARHRLTKKAYKEILDTKVYPDYDLRDR